MYSKHIISGFIIAFLVFSLNAQGFENKASESAPKTDSLSVPIGSKWWAPDKGRHLVGSMISTVFIGKISQEMFDKQSGDSKVWGAGITFSLGLVKEVFDSRSRGNRFSVEDLAANMAGIAIGIVLLGAK